MMLQKPVIGIAGPLFGFGNPRWLDHLGEDDYLKPTDITINELVKKFKEDISKSNSIINIRCTGGSQGLGGRMGPLFFPGSDFRPESVSLKTEPYVGGISWKHPSGISSFYPSTFTLGKTGQQSNIRHKYNNTIYIIKDSTARNLINKFAKEYGVDIENMGHGYIKKIKRW
jgi:hypothetical protein